MLAIVAMLMPGLAGIRARSQAAAPVRRQTSEAELRKAMRAVADAFAVIEPAIPAPIYLLNSVRGDALARVASSREQLQTVRSFFAGRKREDGVAFADDTIAALDDFRGELARAEPDQAAAIDALAGVMGTCAACHAVYREGDEQTGYRLKAGL